MSMQNKNSPKVISKLCTEAMSFRPLSRNLFESMRYRIKSGMTASFLKTLLQQKLIFLLILILFSSCGEQNSLALTDSQGKLTIGLTDASTDLYEAVYITIDKVQIQREDKNHESWTTIFTLGKTYNLLELINGIKEDLGLTELESGTYSQIRLILGEKADDSRNILNEPHPYANYIIDQNLEPHKLKIPSGFQSGIKLTNSFVINENQTTELLLDFDAAKSIIMPGKSGKYILKPTIKILENSLTGIVQGNISDLNDDIINGALVSVQSYHPEAKEIKNEVIIHTSTISNESGSYALYLDPGSYVMVAYKNGYAVDYQVLEVESNDLINLNFTLNTTEVGSAEGKINITDASEDTDLDLSFRQSVDIEGSDNIIEVLSRKIANGGSYFISLPIGEYSLIASSENAETHEETLLVETDIALSADVNVK